MGGAGETYEYDEGVTTADGLGPPPTLTTIVPLSTRRDLEVAPTLATFTVPTPMSTQMDSMSMAMGEIRTRQPTAETFIHTVSRPVMSTGAKSIVVHPLVPETSIPYLHRNYSVMSNTTIPSRRGYMRTNQYVFPTNTSIRGQGLLGERLAAPPPPSVGLPSYPIPHESRDRRDLAPKHDHHHTQPSLRHSSILENQGRRERRTLDEEYVPYNGEYLRVNSFGQKKREIPS